MTPILIFEKLSQLMWHGQNSGATCHTRVHVHECVRVYMCARMCMKNEIAPFSAFLLFYYEHITYILAHSPDFFFMWDYFSDFICTGESRRSSSKSRGTCDNMHI